MGRWPFWSAPLFCWLHPSPRSPPPGRPRLRIFGSCAPGVFSELLGVKEWFLVVFFAELGTFWAKRPNLPHSKTKSHYEYWLQYQLDQRIINPGVYVIGRYSNGYGFLKKNDLHHAFDMNKTCRYLQTIQMWPNMLNGFILRLLKGSIHELDDDDTSWPEI